MSARRAAFADRPRMIELLKEGFARSHYARDRAGKIDESAAKLLLVNCIQEHGSQSYVAVAEKDGVVEGLIVGVVDRIYHIGDKLYASDLFWFCSERADARDALGLLRGMLAWARAVPGCIETQIGVTGIIGDENEAARLGEVLTRLGFAPYGRIYRKELAR
jgi:hypothetical protein